MIYLDTACLVKLYYPEPDGALVAADWKEAVLVSCAGDWRSISTEATRLAEQYTPFIGCWSLDIPYCTVAKVLAAPEFIPSDAHQQKLATVMRLNAVVF